MWTKILIFLVVFFIVANPSTFKIMRKVLGGWVATAEGVAKPGGLILHSAVFVLLAVLLPRFLMRRSYYADDSEEYEDEEYEDEEFTDLAAEADMADAQARISADKAKALRAKLPSSAAPGAPLVVTAPHAPGASKYEDEEFEYAPY